VNLMVVTEAEGGDATVGWVDPGDPVNPDSPVDLDSPVDAGNPIDAGDRIDPLDTVDPGSPIDPLDTLDTAPAPPVEVGDDDLAGALESVLLVADSPVPSEAMAAAVDRPAELVREVLAGLSRRLTEAGSGIDLRETSGGWRFYTRERFAPVVERFVLDGAQARLSRAALESLAVIAYRQPVSRARVAAVRGVNVDGVIRTLVSRGLIEEAGVDAETGGQLFATTELFLDRMGLDSLEDLPALGPLLPDIDSLDDV
jgi:segregation and condensation protein B